MKKLEIVISKMLIHLTYFFTYPLKTKQRVAIISYFNSDYGLEFTKIVDNLKQNDIQVKSNLHSFKGSLLGKFKYLFSFIYQTYLFNTCKVIVLDGNSYVYANIKTKKTVKTYQLWHAIGAIKQFGSEVNRRYQIKGYDYLITSSPFFGEIFAQTLNTLPSNTYSLGNAKSDYLFDKEFIEQQKEIFYQKYPELKNKKIVLYAPTFRGEGIEDMNLGESNIDEISCKLDDTYQIITKYHPLIAKRKNNKYDLSNENLYQLLIVSDVVISDYSALIFDALLLNKKIILYLYDYQQYKEQRGFVLDPKDLGLPLTFNIDQLYDIIVSNFNDVKYQEIKEKYLCDIDGKSSKRISEQLIKILKE